ncbi:MAG: hypothetical protein VX836_19170 [Pseudomonadota bacterium]|nr:hypothetical protein [Pseudomonadota bacterium]
MKTRTCMIAAALFVFGSSIAGAECIKPDPTVVIPDGSTATQAEMVEAQAAFKTYDGKVKAFVDCLNAQERAVLVDRADSLDKDEAQEIHERYAGQVNEIVAYEEGLAERFNAQIKAYKARASAE